jgi:MoaA/NifB/PqqE/SkfB family radical SAM enzyme
MREASDKTGGSEKIRLDVSTVIMSYNFRELAEVYRLAKKIGFDQIFYQAVVMDNTYKSGASDYEKCDFWISGEDLPELEKVINELVSIKKLDENFIFNSATYLKLVPEYFRLKEKFNPGRCLAGYMGLNIDPYGSISVCGMGPDINVKTSSLSELWKDGKFKKTRMMIKKCNVPCLMLCYGKFEAKELLKQIKS